MGPIRWVEQSLQIPLRPACVHKSLGRPGIDAGITCLQNFVIELKDAELEGEFGELPADVIEGELLAGGRSFRNLVPLPCEDGEKGSLGLTFVHGNQCVRASGSEIRIIEAGGMVYIEDFYPA